MRTTEELQECAKRWLGNINRALDNPVEMNLIAELSAKLREREDENLKYRRCFQELQNRRPSPKLNKFKPTNLDCVADGKGKISFPTPPKKEK